MHICINESYKFFPFVPSAYEQTKVRLNTYFKTIIIEVDLKSTSNALMTVIMCITLVSKIDYFLMNRFEMIRQNRFIKTPRALSTSK